MRSRILSDIKGYFVAHRARLLLLALLLLASTALSLVLPLMIRRIVDAMIADRVGSGFTMLCAAALALVAVKGVTRYLLSYSTAWLGQRITIDLRRRFFAHLLGLPMSFFGGRERGDLCARLFTDLQQIHMTAVLGSLYVLRDVIFFAGVLVMILLVSPKALAFFACGGAIMGALTLHFSRAMRERALASQQRLAAVNSRFLEVLPLVTELKSFVRRDWVVGRFVAANHRFLEAALRQARISAAAAPMMDLFLFGTLLAIIWLSIGELRDGGLTVGGLVGLFLYLSFLVAPVQGIASFALNVGAALASAERVYEILTLVPETEDAPDAAPLPQGVPPDVCFENVTLTYDNSAAPALAGVDLVIRHGETVTIVGGNGSGKSSLVALILRLERPTSGRVLIAGRDAARWQVDSIRRRSGLVPQFPALIGGTVLENILFGREDVGLEEVREVAGDLGLDAMITHLPDGYQTRVGEEGVKLSGGERQAIAIVRALLSAPDLLILDEATASLDPRLEIEVNRKVAHLRAGKTTIIVSHRIGSVCGAERLIVMTAGRVAETGSHAELMRRDGAYRRLFQGQYRLVRGARPAGDDGNANRVALG